MSSRMRSAWATGGDSRGGRGVKEHPGLYIPAGRLQRLSLSAKLGLGGGCPGASHLARAGLDTFRDLPASLGIMGTMPTLNFIDVIKKKKHGVFVKPEIFIRTSPLSKQC